MLTHSGFLGFIPRKYKRLKYLNYSEGNIHTATMIIDKDAVYYLNITGKDALGNDAEETVYTGTAPQHWVLDTVMNTPSIDHVVNDTAYNGTIVPEITVLDPNIDRIILKLIRTRMYEIEVDVTDLLLTEETVIYQDTTGGQKVALDIFPFEEGMDGEYTLVVQVLDKAGNEASNQVNFYTNRYGSVYLYDDSLTAIMNGYHKEITNDITITEFNPPGIKDGSAVVQITVDGVPIPTPSYTTTPVSNSESGWFEYVHVISKSNFTTDGVYEVVLSSKDTAGNVPENTAEDLEIRFAIDTTSPELPSIIGLEENIVKADSTIVTLSAMDNVLLDSITVYLNGKVPESWNGLDSYSGEHSFMIPAGLEHTVRLVVVDKAGNVLDTADSSFSPGYEFNDTITVSTNFFLRLYADRVLFYLTIAGVAIAVAGSITLIVIITKKKKAKQSENTTTT